MCYYITFGNTIGGIGCLLNFQPKTVKSMEKFFVLFFFLWANDLKIDYYYATTKKVKLKKKREKNKLS